LGSGAAVAAAAAAAMDVCWSCNRAQRRFAAACCASFAGISFGVLPPFLVKAYDNGATPLTYVLIRAAVATVIFGSSLIASTMVDRTNQDTSAKPHANRIRTIGLLVVATVCYSGFSLSYMTSIRHLAVSTAALIFYTYPLVVLARSLLPCGAGTSSRPGAAFLILHLTAFLGLALSLSPELAAGTDSGGVALAVTASITFAGYVVAAAELSRMGVPSCMVATIVNGGQSIVFVVILLGGFLDWGLPDDTGGAWAFGVAVLAYCTAQAFIYAGFALAREGPLVAFFLNVEPLVSILLAVAMLGEHLTWYRWVGVAILIISLSASALIAPGEASNQHLEKDAAGSTNEEPNQPDNLGSQIV